MGKQRKIGEALFITSLLLIQLWSYNPLTLASLGCSFFFLSSGNCISKGINNNFLFFCFLLLSFLVGTFKYMTNSIEDTSSHSLLAWSQYYIFCALFISVKDKKSLLMKLRYILIIIFVLDFITNVLLYTGFSLFWAHVPTIRGDEILPRYGGIKGNSLYSGLISFSLFCFQIVKLNKNIKKGQVFILLIIIINVLLSGSYRYYIYILVGSSLYLTGIYKRKILQMCLLILSCISIIIATFFSLNGSNVLRFKLWRHAYKTITLDTGLLGTGFFSPDTSLIHTVQHTFSGFMRAGVTESTVLLIGICFGLPIMILFLFSIFRTFLKTSFYLKLEPELFLFLGCFLSDAFGGGIENLLNLSLFLLSMYIINEKRYSKRTSLR